MSGELSTFLFGRYVEFKMFPLSFKEYADYYKQEGDEKLYLKYVNNGSMPYALLDNQDLEDKIKDQRSLKEYKDPFTGK